MLQLRKGVDYGGTYAADLTTYYYWRNPVQTDSPAE